MRKVKHALHQLENWQIKKYLICLSDDILLKSHHDIGLILQ
jgi:hypothetical protein